MKKESESMLYCNIQNNEKGHPKFFIGDKSYGLVSGTLAEARTEKKKIIPKKGENQGKEITVYNLLLRLVDFDGEFMLTIPLYSSIGRTVLNALAGPDELDEIFFQVYNNKYGYRSISIKKGDQKDSPYYTGKYTFDELQKIVEEKKIKGEMKKDWDSLTDKLIEELLPIIQKKASYGQDDEKKTETPKNTNNDDDLPF